MSGHLSSILAPVVTGARAVLADLEPGQVPASLRRVVAHGGRRLPPPLLKSLLVELDRHEWLRTRTAEAIGPGGGELVSAFLAAEPGWWVGLGDAMARAAAEAAADTTAEATVADLETRLAEAKRRHGELRAERDRLITENRSLRRELRNRPRDVRSVGPGDEATDRADRLERELEEAQAARADAERRVADLRRRARRRSPSPGPAAPEPAVRGFGLDDPVEVGRRLDLHMATLASASGAPPLVAASGSPPAPVVAVPAGVAPDTAAAIDWLVGVEATVTVIVDGYNVTYLLDPEEFAGGDLRRRLVAGVARIRRRSTPGHRAVVVFDSVDTIEGDRDVGPAGVEVRFTVGERIADDEIVELAAAVDGPVVIISNDRELRERAEAVGSVTLWGSALAAWLR